MSSKVQAARMCCIALAALALFHLGSSRVYAQLPSACPVISSFEFPLWSDGVGWNQPYAYSSIQMADIDGDGQDELIGNGPAGVEVWHWEQNGQAWTQMSAAGPPLATTDTLMTADVDGDGQAEMIQVTANAQTSVLNVWHYDGAANPRFAGVSSGPGVWRLQPQLRLILKASFDANGQPVPPLLSFGRLTVSGNQQQLVQMYFAPGANGLFLAAEGWQVNATGTGWSNVLNGTPYIANLAPFFAYGPSLKVGDVNGDGLPDLVVFSPGDFLVFTQQPSSSPSALKFTGGLPLADPSAQATLLAPPFLLADVLGRGYDQLITLEYNYSGTQDLRLFQYTPAALQPVGMVPTATTHPIYLQSVPTAFSKDRNTQSLFQLNSDGLDEYSGPSLSEVSNTPYINQSRFGDNLSHSSTIQTGRVYTTQGVLQTIVVARDTGGIHTFLPNNNGCGSPQAGFAGSQRYYFPPFTTAGTAAAYSFLSNLADPGQNNIQSEYQTNAANAQAYYNKISLPYVPSNNFSISEYQNVQQILQTQLTDVGQVYSYMQARKTDTEDIFTAETSEFNQIVTALGIPSDYSLQGPLNQLALNLPQQAVYAAMEFAGNAGVPVFSQVGEAVSVISEVITDVQQTTPQSCGSSCAQLVLQTQLATWAKNADTQVALAQDKVLQNWDLLQTLSQEINSGTLLSTATTTDQVKTAAETAFEIGTWQTLTPNVWSVNFWELILNESGAAPAGYPYQYSGTVADSAMTYPCSTTINYQVYPELTSTTGFLGAYSPVAVTTMQELLSLGVDWHDIVAGRNGWNLPLDAHTQTHCPIPSNFTQTIPSNPVVTPPPAQPAPASLILNGGQASGTQYQCNGAYITAPEQSTPINSVFPEPFQVQVKALNGEPVANAQVQLSGRGLSPAISTVVTDGNGAATFPLVANAIIQGPYPVTAQVTWPARDPGAQACSLVGQYQLTNTPAVDGTTAAATDVQAVVSVASKGQIFTTDRRWNLSIVDPTTTATGGTITGQLTHTRGPASCQPVSVVGDNLHPTATPGAFTSTMGWNFSSCTGLNVFTLTVTGTFTIPLDNGATYNASYSGTINNQTP